MKISQLYSDSAKRWKESARYWRDLASKQIDDVNTALFAIQQSRQCDQWAAEDLELSIKFAAKNN